MTALAYSSREAAEDVEDTAAELSLRNWLAVVAMAVGTFTMVTVEQLPVGLLTSIGASLGVSDGTAGLMVTVPGLVAAVAAPILPVAIRRLDRKKVLFSLIGLMVLANLLSALSDSFAVLLGARFLIGVTIGGFWAMGAGIAIRIVPERHVARATALFFGGATAANVIGVPAATLLGGLTNWRIAFVAVGGLGILVAGALLALLPDLPATRPLSLRSLAEQARVPAVRAGAIATFLLIGGHYAAFTFVSPMLQDVAGVGERAVAPLLLGMGAAGIAGTLLAGSAASRDVRRTLITTALVLAATLALFPFAARTPVTALALLLVWGLAFGAVPVGVQTWIFKAAPDAAEAATAVNTTMFNLAIAVGALGGGVVVDAASPSWALLLGAAMVAITVAVVAAVRPEPRA